MSEYAASRLGETLDRYRLEAVLGEGGFGAVYRARHVMMDRAVALKLLHPRMAHREVQERFVREARTLARLGHPHIVGIHDCGVAATGEIFLAMELLEGEDLAGVLERRGALPPAEAVGLIVPVLEALEAAHAAGVVHRDLKPANVFLARVRGETVPKLLDFGISKVEGAGAERKLTRTGSVMGTPHYMAPETLRGAGEVDHRADLYAVGVMLYELIAGRTPHEAESYEALVVRIATDPVPPLGTVAPAAAPALAAAVDRALAREPGARFGSAAEMAAALRAAVGAGGEMAHAATAASGDWQPVAAEGRRATGRRGTGPLTDPRDGMPSTAVATPSSWRPPTPPPGTPGAGPVAPSPVASTTPLERRGRGPIVAMALGAALLAGLAGVGVFVALEGRSEPAGAPPTAPVAAGPPAGPSAPAASGSVVLRSAEPPKPPAVTDALGARLPGAARAAGSSGAASAAAASAAAASAAAPSAAAPSAAAPSVAPSAGVAAPSAEPSNESAASGGPAARVDSRPAPTQAPAAGGRIRVHEPRVVGEVPTDAIFDLVERRRSRLERCRRDRAHRVAIHLHVHAGRITLAGPNPNVDAGDPEVARCVANVLREGGPLPAGQGIVQLTVDVPPG